MEAHESLRKERLLWGTLASAALPLPFARCLWDSAWRDTIEERCGAKSDQLRKLDGAIWFHGASLGEVTGLVPIAAALKDAAPCFATTTSTTGRAEALKRAVAAEVRLLPLDHPYFIGRLLDAVRPRLFILAETELWPNLFLALERRQIPLVVVNGRISNRTFPRYRAARGLFAPLLAIPRLILVQTERDRERYLAIGAVPERVKVTGSTKYANPTLRRLTAEADRLFLKFGMRQDAPLAVFGSVRPGEDEATIAAYLGALKEYPALQLIIAPRHPERFDAVAELLRRAGLRFIRRSQQGGERAQVLLLDTIGELVEAYSIATLSFVGGTLVPIGGHNPLEPAAFASPVFVGPHYGNVTDAVDELVEAGGISVVRDGESLQQELVRLLRDPVARARQGRAAFGVWERNSTALERVLPELRALL